MSYGCYGDGRWIYTDGDSMEYAKVIRMRRTEQGKALRKKYEAHLISHGFNEFREPYVPEDNVSNTISTVLKDNIVIVWKGNNYEKMA